MYVVLLHPRGSFIFVGKAQQRSISGCGGGGGGGAWVHGTVHNVTMNDLSQRVEIEHSASVKDEEVRNQLAYYCLLSPPTWL